MSNNKMLKNNKFANCTRSELVSLWYSLKRIYIEGWDVTGATDNPLTPYKNAYCEESHIGLALVRICLQQLLVNFWESCKFTL